MSVENEKEIQQLKNRIRELADKSYNQNQYTFTGFLGLAEQDALWQVEREVKFAGITLYGGREEAERKLLRFGSEAELGYEQPFPICCIRIRLCRQNLQTSCPTGLSGGADEPWH